MESPELKFDLHYENTPENLQYWMKEIPEFIKICFKIENLSNNELFIIKKITQDVLFRMNTIDKGLQSDDKYSLDREVTTRFLIEAYGIDVGYMNKWTENDQDMEQFFEYIRRTREKAHLI